MDNVNYKEKDAQCPKGYRWCPIRKRCVPAGQEKGKGQRQARGQGQGPMGVPMIKVKEVMDLVDYIFDSGFEQYGKFKKAEEAIDFLLDACKKMREEEQDLEESVFSNPYDQLSGIKIDVDVSEGDFQPGFASDEDEDEDSDEHLQKKQNDIDTVPDQNLLDLFMSVRKQLGEYKSLSEDGREKYKAYFNSMLKKYGVNSPAELPADKKKEFFNAVDKGWKAVKEQKWDILEGKLRDRYNKMRCEKIMKDIASFKGYKGKLKKKYGNNPKKYEYMKKQVEGAKQGLILQAKKWGCM